MTYPIWSRRRLEATQEFLEEQFRLLATERVPLRIGHIAPSGAVPPIEFVEQRFDLLRQASERLKSVCQLLADTISKLPDATLLADVSGGIILANQAAAVLFGVEDYRQLEDRSVDDYLYAQTQSESLRYAALTAHAPCSIEAALPQSARQLLIRAVSFGDHRQGPVGILIALADITDLRAAQRERDEVLRFLSHDMKSPASSLLGLAQLQRDPDRALPPHELSQRLDLLAQRLLALVDGFVALARAESTDPSVFDDFDLRDAIQDAYDEVWATARAHDNTVTTTMPDEPIAVHGDRPLMARAIVNLLTNAVKFSPEGAPILLTCHQEASQVTVKIADCGPGIAAEAATALFRRFSRGLHRGATDPGGAGLGLAFVRVVAEKHRGHAWVESNEGQPGAVFCISLDTAIADHH